jgi:hypothetical protein
LRSLDLAVAGLFLDFNFRGVQQFSHGNSSIEI